VGSHVEAKVLRVRIGDEVIEPLGHAEGDYDAGGQSEAASHSGCRVAVPFGFAMVGATRIAAFSALAPLFQ
jgi:hypothetical protein